MDKQKITIIVLAVALILISQYVLLDKWSLTQQQQNLESYQNGYAQGLIDAITSIYQQTQNCQITTVNVGNSTKDIVDISCLEIVSEESSP